MLGGRVDRGARGQPEAAPAARAGRWASARLASLMLAVAGGIRLQWMVGREIDMSQAVSDPFVLLDWSPADAPAP